MSRESVVGLLWCVQALLQFGNWIWVHTLIKKEPIWLKRTNWSWVLLLLVLLHLANALLQSLIFLQLGFFNYETKEYNKNPTRNRNLYPNLMLEGGVFPFAFLLEFFSNVLTQHMGGSQATTVCVYRVWRSKRCRWCHPGIEWYV